MNLPTHKVCTKCGIDKPLDNFYRNKKGKFGRLSHCVPCHAAHVKTFRAANPRGYTPEQRLAQKKWREDNREKVRVVTKEWKAANPEKVREYFSNRDKKLEKARKERWKLTKPDSYRASTKKRARKSVDNLLDHYIANMMKIPVKDAPPELIEAKRVQLMIHRFITRGVSK